MKAEIEDLHIIHWIHSQPPSKHKLHLYSLKTASIKWLAMIKIHELNREVSLMEHLLCVCSRGSQQKLCWALKCRSATLQSCPYLKHIPREINSYSFKAQRFVGCLSSKGFQPPVTHTTGKPFFSCPLSSHAVFMFVLFNSRAILLNQD